MLLSQACAFLGDQQRAGTLYQLLQPYSETNGQLGYAAACSGATARYLGLLATTMDQWEAARAHFESALEMNARIVAKPYVAHTQHEYAGMLLRQGLPEDHDAAIDLLQRALVTGQQLGMKSLLDRANTIKFAVT